MHSWHMKAKATHLGTLAEVLIPFRVEGFKDGSTLGFQGGKAGPPNTDIPKE